MGPSRVEPFEGETDIFIYPGYRFQIADALLTNFHLPESTLLMLVCAFGGTEQVLGAYRHAVQERCDQIGLALTRLQLDEVYRRMVALADEKKVITDEDLRAIATAVYEAGKAQGREAVTHEAGYGFGV